MFRFTIRDVLWLTVVVAVICGWVLEYRNRGPEYAKLNKHIEKLNADIANLVKKNQQDQAKATAQYNERIKMNRDAYELFRRTTELQEQDVRDAKAAADSLRQQIKENKPKSLFQELFDK